MPTMLSLVVFVTLATRTWADFKQARLFVSQSYDSYTIMVSELKFFDGSGAPIATPCTSAGASCTAVF